MKKTGAGAPTRKNQHLGKKHGGAKKKRVPLPDDVRANDLRHASLEDDDMGSSDVSLDDEDLEMLDDLGNGGLQFLSRLPTKDMDEAVSQARGKKAVPRHKTGEDPRVHADAGKGGKGRDEMDSPYDSEDDSAVDSDVDSEEEAWERGPRGRAGTGTASGSVKAAALARKIEKGQAGLTDKSGVQETGGVAAGNALGTKKTSSRTLPIKIHGSMVHVDPASDGLDAQMEAINPDAFEGVTVLDDGRSSKAAAERQQVAREAQEKARAQAEKAAAKKAAQAKQTEEVELAMLRADKEREENKEEKYREEALKVLLGCKSKSERREKAKMVIAKAAQTLLGEPERQLRRQMPILLELVADLDVNVAKLSMLSIFAVMRDIIPAYKIRPQHEREKDDVVQSKEVKELWAYENALLKAYQSYLKVLLKAFKGQKEAPKSKSALTLGRAAAKCLASLIIALPHFNYSGDILQVIVPGIANKDVEIKQECAGAISELVKGGLKSAESGQAAVEATQLLADFAKRRNCTGLPPEVVSCLMDFTFPDITSAEDLADAKRSRKSNKKKNKRKGKDERDVSRAFKEAQAVIDKDTRRHQQSVVLEAMFEMYFRVLKTTDTALKGVHRHDTQQGHWSQARFQKRFPLLAPTLQGLAKFAHLISIDYFQDIISTLEDILESPCVPHDIRCRCLLTASDIAKGQAESLSLNVDRAALYKELYKAMYSTMEIPLEDDDQSLPQLLSRKTFHDGYPGSALTPPIPLEETPPVLLAKVLDDMLLDSRKTLDIHRQAAFTKRAATIALQTVDSGLALTMLYVIYRMLKRYPKLRSMIEDDEGAGPSTSFYGTILNKTCTSKEFADQDPSLHEGALYTPLWELSILAGHHSNPGVRKAAAFVSMMSVNAARAAATGETGEQAHALGALFGGCATPADVCLNSSTARGSFVPSVKVGHAGPAGRKRKGNPSGTAGQDAKARANDDVPAGSRTSRTSRWVGVLCDCPLPFPTIGDR